MSSYVVLRSNSNKHVHVICHESAFDDLPDEIRHRGPWQLHSRGPIERLKLKYRASLAKHGYVLEITPVPTFQPEV